MSLLQEWPEVYDELLKTKNILENHYKTVCGFEFTVEKGVVYILNWHPTKLSSKAHIRTTINFFLEGKIDLYNALASLASIGPEDIYQVIGSELENKSSLKLIGNGISAYIKSATGRVLLKNQCGHEVFLSEYIYVCEEVFPEDIGILLNMRAIVTSRGGRTSHVAVIARGMNKACVCGVENINIDLYNRTLQFGNNIQVVEGEWISIDGNDGSVYLGKAVIKEGDWRSIHEVAMFFEMIRHVVVNNNLLPYKITGTIWLFWDFFIHGMPLVSTPSNKKPISSKNRTYTSFNQSSESQIKESKLNLIDIPFPFRLDVSRIIMGFSDTLHRILSQEIGIGNHYQYYKPLCDPEYTLHTTPNGVLKQFIGFEFFNVSRYIKYLGDISSVIFHVEVILSSEDERWFLDFTNPHGESLICGTKDIVAYNIYVNGASISLSELACFYSQIRRREYSQFKIK